jgi:hypothetical protein
MSRGKQEPITILGGNTDPAIGVGGESDGAVDAGNHTGGAAEAAAPGLIVIDPAELGGRDGSGDGSGGNAGPGEPAKRRRGRPRGSTNRRSQKAPDINVNGLESILLSAHAMLAGIVQSPTLALDPTEAKQLSEAIAQVGRHYDMSVPAKTLDWTNLLMVCGAVYGPRVAIMVQEARAKRSVGQRPARPSPADTQHVNGADKSEGGPIVVDIPGVGKVVRH